MHITILINFHKNKSLIRTLQFFFINDFSYFFLVSSFYVSQIQAIPERTSIKCYFLYFICSRANESCQLSWSSLLRTFRFRNFYPNPIKKKVFNWVKPISRNNQITRQNNLVCPIETINQKPSSVTFHPRRIRIEEQKARNSSYIKSWLDSLLNYCKKSILVIFTPSDLMETAIQKQLIFHLSQIQSISLW